MEHAVTTLDVISSTKAARPLLIGPMSRRTLKLRNLLPPVGQEDEQGGNANWLANPQPVRADLNGKVNDTER